jgi:hypothetical protein
MLFCIPLATAARKKSPIPLLPEVAQLLDKYNVARERNQLQREDP